MLKSVLVMEKCTGFPLRLRLQNKSPNVLHPIPDNNKKITALMETVKQ